MMMIPMMHPSAREFHLQWRIRCRRAEVVLPESIRSAQKWLRDGDADGTVSANALLRTSRWFGLQASCSGSCSSTGCRRRSPLPRDLLGFQSLGPVRKRFKPDAQHSEILRKFIAQALSAL